MKYDHLQHESERKDYWGLRYTLGVVAMLGILAFFLLTEHRAHLYSALTYLLLLAFPLMHLFMHGGHGGHGGHNNSDEDSSHHSRHRSASPKAWVSHNKGDPSSIL